MLNKLFIVLLLSFVSFKFYGQQPGAPLRLQTFTPADTAHSHDLATFSPGKDYYTKNLSFFCRQEWKFERATGLPLRLRVGSLAQCNLLEGKK
jgi:hypothetical protein